MRRLLVSLLLGCAVSTAALAQTAARPPVPAALGQIPGPYGAPVTLATADGLLARAQAEAKRLNLLMAFAITDPAGDLVAFARMDGVQTASLQIAQDKARAAARFRRPTRYWAEAIANGRPQLVTLDGVVGSEGGIPIDDAQGRVIGGIGASGGTGEQDAAVATVALRPPSR